MLLSVEDEISMLSLSAGMFRFVYPPLVNFFVVDYEPAKGKECALKYADTELGKGIPNTCLAYDNGTYRSLWILVLRKKWGHVGAKQQWWIERLNSKGNLALVCHGSKEAWSIMMDYLGIEWDKENI